MSFINMDKRFKISKMLIDNYIFILLMLVIATQRGSKALGYDSAASCSPNGKLSRRGRAQMLAAIPCDLTRQPYCNLPGAAYPWHAVRRFVHENQGLMKRMYGDMLHKSVVKDEMKNNEINIKDIEVAAERYSRSEFRRSSKFMSQSVDDFSYSGSNNIKNNDIITEPHFRPMTTTARSNTITATAETTTTEESITEEISSSITAAPIRGKPGNTTELAKFKATDTDDDQNLASNSVYELPTLTSNELNSEQSNNGDNIEIIESPKLELGNLSAAIPMISATLKATQLRTSTTPATTTSTLTSSTEITQNNATTLTPTVTTTKRTASTSEIYHRRRPQYPYRQRPKPQQIYSTQQSTQKPVTITKDSQTANESEHISSTPATKPTASSLITTSTTSSTKTQSNAFVKDFSDEFGSSNSTQNFLTNKSKPMEKISTILTSTQNTSSMSTVSSTVLKPKIDSYYSEKFRKNSTTHSNKLNTPASSDSSASDLSATKPPVLHDGQLFQDTVKQEPTPMVNLRGVNACPIKEEVVAPFWANNTRGEVLALLNLYPFEQYVHWEKCTHEHKQMYCRDGCRCEQQYRLHRLLAYDPRNECRGIFSDWFRFPSCCICKCYNIPMDFRATSRSPRMQSFPEDEEAHSNYDETPISKHPLEIAEEEVKRAVYEHATEDWYRPRDYDENFDNDNEGDYWEV